MRATRRRIRWVSHCRRFRCRARRKISREEILTTAGVTGRASLLFLDADAARARLMANPWIADAAVLKLYPDRLQITITERQAFALWQKDGTRQRHRRTTAPCLSRLSSAAMSACRWWSGRAPSAQRQGFPRHSRSVPRHSSSQVRASILVAQRRWNLAAEQRHRRRAAGEQCRGRAAIGWSRSTATKSSCRATSPRRSAPARSRDRAAVRRRRAGAR